MRPAAIPSLNYSPRPESPPLRARYPHFTIGRTMSRLAQMPFMGLGFAALVSVKRKRRFITSFVTRSAGCSTCLMPRPTPLFCRMPFASTRRLQRRRWSGLNGRSTSPMPRPASTILPGNSALRHRCVNLACRKMESTARSIWRRRIPIQIPASLPRTGSAASLERPGKAHGLAARLSIRRDSRTQSNWPAAAAAERGLPHRRQES